MTESALSTNAHHVPGMSFDLSRVDERRKTLGASEIPAVAGLNAKKSALDVYLEKKGLVAPFSGNAFTEWGLRLEDAIAQKYQEVVGGIPLRRCDTIIRDGWMSATPDRLVSGVDDHGDPFDHGLEIKRFGDYRTDDFGPAGTAEVPLDVTAQCVWSMIVTGLRRWDVAVLIGQADFRIYQLHWDDDSAGVLQDIGYDFWHKHVLMGVEPAVDGSKSAQKYLQQKYASHTDELRDATPELFATARQLASVKAEIKALETEESALTHRIQSAIGEAAGIRNVATWKLDKTGRVGWKNVAEDLGATKPEHAALLTRHTSMPSRRFRLLATED